MTVVLLGDIMILRNELQLTVGEVAEWLCRIYATNIRESRNSETVTPLQPLFTGYIQ